MHVKTRGLAVLVGVGAIASIALSAPAGATPVLPVIPASSTAHKTTRACATPKSGYAACLAIRVTDTVEPGPFSTTDVTPDATPAGFGPSSLQSAYALPSATAGSGQTVAIVDAYDDPNAEADLAAYRSQYGLPACTSAGGCFKKVSQTGSTTNLPAGDTGWAGEISLDVDMVSAICPNCHILLVEATSPSNTDLGTAVNEAVSLGAKFVSNSYGGSEPASANSYDASYYHHPGVAITASSGDGDYGAEYPATGQYVTAVGGTSLKTASTPRGWSETVWKTTTTEGTGSGCSSFVAKPSFQGSVTTGCTKRAEADVSAVADPATGVAVYQTYGASGWAVYGGTSAASPIVAGVYALAGTPGATDSPNAYPYAHPGNLNDVTSGNNGNCSPTVLCTAGTGWDGPTGLGTPNGVTAFRSGSGPAALSAANPGNQTGKVATAASLQLSASGGTAPYTWTAGGLPAGLTISSAGLISGKPTTAATYAVTATVTDAAHSTASVSFSWTINPATGGGCASAGQKLGNPGFESGSSPWTSTSGVISASGSGEPAHTGGYDAWLDGYGMTHSDTLSQSVSIPAGCSATLTFYLHIDTAETTTTTAYDKLTVKLGSSTLATYSNLNQASGYLLRTFAVSSFAGQTPTLTFTGTEDSSLQTSFVVDDTALTAS